MVDKRFQVFVSSTFDDLREERQTVMQALLELDCIPSGMELFPASDEEQWGYIQKTIDDCDYYILILAGKYGSLGPDGRSFTQMEYEYALAKNKPTIAFLHADPGKLAAERTERSENTQVKLESFRELARRKLCRFWSSQEELGAIVSRSISQLKKTRPAIGWVRANLIGDESASQEIARLRRKIEELESQLQEYSVMSAEEAKTLAQGDETLEIYVSGDQVGGGTFIELTWREAFGAVLARILAPASEDCMKAGLEDLVDRKYPELLFDRVYVSRSDFDRVKIQLCALGLTDVSSRATEFGDEAVWRITPKGISKLGLIAGAQRPIESE